MASEGDVFETIIVYRFGKCLKRAVDDINITDKSSECIVIRPCGRI